MSGPTARPLRDLGLKDTVVLRGMIASAVIRKAGPERYFLDEAVWAARRHWSLWHLVLVVVGVLLAVGVGAILLVSGS